MCSWGLNIFKGEGSTSLSDLVQSLTNLIVKEVFLLLGQSFLCCSLCPLPPLLSLSASKKSLALSSLAYLLGRQTQQLNRSWEPWLLPHVLPCKRAEDAGTRAGAGGLALWWGNLAWQRTEVKRLYSYMQPCRSKKCMVCWICCPHVVIMKCTGFAYLFCKTIMHEEKAVS